MKINRQELLTALAAVKPALASKEVVEQSTAFAFAGNQVMAFNDEIAITYPVETGITGAIQAQELYKLLSKCSDESLEFNITEGDDKAPMEIQVKGRRVTAGIRMHSEVRLPMDKINYSEDWFPLPQNFIEGLSFCLPVAGSDMAKPALTCVHLLTYANADEQLFGVIQACDNFKIVEFYLDGPWLADEAFQDTWGSGVLIPASSASGILSHDPVEMSIAEGWIHFINETGAIYSIRTIAAEYPKVGDFLQVEGARVELPSDLNDVLDRASIFSSSKFDQDNEVELKIGGGWAYVKSMGETGWLEEKSRAKYDGQPVCVRLHPDSLKIILEHTQTATIGQNAMLFNGSNFTFSISLSAE